MRSRRSGVERYGRLVKTAAVNRFHREAPSMRVLRWIILPLLTVHVVLASISGYRAIVQIYRVDLHVSDPVLRPGSTLGFGYVSSARVPSDAELELIQGAHKESLAKRELPANVNPSYDPRSRSAMATVVLTAEQLARFEAGPAVVRVTAYGNMQWLRTPPPEVREVHVQLQPR
jgi:hypothetical protein